MCKKTIIALFILLFGVFGASRMAACASDGFQAQVDRCCCASFEDSGCAMSAPCCCAVEQSSVPILPGFQSWSLSLDALPHRVLIEAKQNPVAIDQAEWLGTQRKPLHLATNKVYLEKRVFLI